MDRRLRRGCLRLTIELGQDLFHMPLDHAIVVLFDEIHTDLALVGVGGLAV